MIVISRKQAINLKLIRYYTGSPCKRGHLCERQTSNGVCLQCHALKETLANAADPLRAKARNSRFYKKNSEKEKQRRKDYYSENREKSIASVRSYQIKNPSVKRAIDAKRRACKLQRTPDWADINSIKQFYAECPQGMVVDHEIPLQGELVSGLHVLNNLQYLTPSENSAKGNRFNSFS